MIDFSALTLERVARDKPGEGFLPEPRNSGFESIRTRIYAGWAVGGRFGP